MYPIEHAAPLQRFLRLVRSRWVLILGITLVMATVSVGASSARDRLYVSQAVLALGQPSGYEGSAEPHDVTDQQLTLQAMTVTSTQVAARARELGATGQVSVSPPARSNAIVITGAGDSPAVAQRTADAYAKAYMEFRDEQARLTLESGIKQLEQQISSVSTQLAELSVASRGASAAQRLAMQSQRVGLTSQQTALMTDLGRLQVRRAVATSGVAVLQSPELPVRAVSPQPLRDGAVAAVLGLVLSLGLAYLLEGSVSTRKWPTEVDLGQVERREQAAYTGF